MFYASEADYVNFLCNEGYNTSLVRLISGDARFLAIALFLENQGLSPMWDFRILLTVTNKGNNARVFQYYFASLKK